MNVNLLICRAAANSIDVKTVPVADSLSFFIVLAIVFLVMATRIEITINDAVK